MARSGESGSMFSHNAQVTLLHRSQSQFQGRIDLLSDEADVCREMLAERLRTMGLSRGALIDSGIGPTRSAALHTKQLLRSPPGAASTCASPHPPPPNDLA